LKDQYLAGLGDLHEISMKLQGDNHVAPQKPANLHEEANFKGTLERSLHSLEINKNCVQLSLEENTPMYKKQITNILNSKEWTSEEAFHRSAAQD
jgi:PAX-interacting protein 1